MADLIIDTTSPTWRTLLAYVDQRKAELANECVGLSAAPERRQELAARFAELTDLVDAPMAAARGVALRGAFSHQEPN